ncbi:LLM class flavin-dependent oxidoreductase [Schumannella luteola]|nr:LLM class flavin-dependent oxidoreductase [Schumannella luteola]TPX01426.1 LLM class flavin-dependent oxidoreductase [Schumannella luteola]
MQLSITVPGQINEAGAVRSTVSLVNKSPAARLWIGQSFLLDGMQTLAYVAGTGASCPVGVGVSLAAMRSPYESALQVRTLAALSGQPVSAGFGAAQPGFVRAVSGEEWSAPGQALLDYAAAVKDAFDPSAQPRDSARFTSPALPPLADAPAIEVGVGAVRPWLFSRGLQQADFVATWLAPSHYVATQLEQTSASRARLVCIAPLAVSRIGRSIMVIAREAVGHHIRQPHYAEMLSHSGLLRESEESTVKSLLDSGTVLNGHLASVIDQLRTLETAGVDEVVLDATAVRSLRSHDEALDDYEAVLNAWSNRKGSPE